MQMTAKEVLAHRTFLGLLQRELAVKLGCSLSTIGKWERGIKTISKTFRVKLQEMVRTK